MPSAKKTVTRQDLDQIRDLFGDQAMTEVLNLAAGQMGALGESYLREYPESPNGRPLDKVYQLNGKPSKFKTVKQRRYVMAAIRAGNRILEIKRLRKRKSQKAIKAKAALVKAQKASRFRGKPILLPYRRTGQYGAAFTHKIVSVKATGVQIQWGNNKNYGPFVGGEPPTGNPYGYVQGHQSMYHAKTGWKSARVELEQHLPDLKAQLGKTVKAELLRRLKERG